MKKLEQDDQTKSILKNGLLEKAPEGMVDRIMANIAVSPVRRKLTIKAVEPKNNMAIFMAVVMGVLVMIAAYIQPETKLSFSIDQYVNLHISQVWMAPVIVISLTVWGYIIISKKQIAKT